MKRALPPYVYAKKAKGKTYYRFQKGIVSQTIDPSADTFWQTYADLVKRDAPSVPTSKTFHNLIKRYKASKKWVKLAPRTQADYNKVLAHIEAVMGEKNPAAVRKVHVVEWQEQLTGRFASYFVQVLSVLMNHASEIGWRDDNPCDGVTLATTERKAEHVVWTDAAIQTFREGAKPIARLIFELGLGTVQRPDDLTRMNWEDFDGEAIHMTQQKTGRVLRIPCPAELLAQLAIHRPKVMNLRGKTPILSIGRKRMTYRRMAEIMLDERKRLKVAQHDLHALRYRGVMDLAFGGASDEEIGSISGHESKEMIRKYAGDARQIMLAKSANKKRGA